MSVEPLLQLNLNPKRLFLMDGLGALTSAGLLFFLLAGFEDFFGMPKAVLQLLSLIAILFSAYSFCCSLLVKQNWKTYLTLIAIANFCYILLTSALVIYNYVNLTIWGLFYFIGEIAIIITVVYIERKAVINS